MMQDKHFQAILLCKPGNWGGGYQRLPSKKVLSMTIVLVTVVAQPQKYILVPCRSTLYYRFCPAKRQIFKIGGDSPPYILNFGPWCKHYLMVTDGR